MLFFNICFPGTSHYTAQDLLVIKDTKKEGRGVFSRKHIAKGEVLCNYGGIHVTAKGLESTPNVDNNYLLEFLMTNKKGNSEKHYLFHTPETMSVGALINHSKKHPSVIPKLHCNTDGIPDIHFVALNDMEAATELCYCYGDEFGGVSDCLSSCKVCGKGFKCYCYFLCKI